MTSPAATDSGPHIARLGARQRAVRLQRRRFWREIGYGAVMTLADLVTLAAAFSLLAALPVPRIGSWLGPDGPLFLAFLLPSDPIALLRRLSALIFCLVATRSYSYTEREFHSGRILAALLLGLALPRWTEIWTAYLPERATALGLVLVILWAALVWQRRVLIHALRSLDPRALEPARTLIVGPAGIIAGVREDWQRRVQDPDGDEVAPSFFEISPEWPTDTMGGPGELFEALTVTRADAVLLVGPLGDAALQSLMIAASSAGCRVFATRRRAFQQLDEPSFLLRRAEPLALLSRPALVGVQLVVKRSVDLTGAVLGLLLFAPVWFLVALAIRLTSRGPVLFRQVRVGLGGDLFTVLKFRTMVADAEAQLPKLRAQNQYADEPLFKMKSDPRLTVIGKFLRRSSLDEMPQLFNVLRGEMSLVGPRPALPAEVALYRPHHFVRFEVLPGITGPWQVAGRNVITDFEDVVRLEASYIRGWTVWRDLRILARTVPAVISMKGAY
jgi:exopolysaccharide biosynthesis polyprenyl glycosylphosphotransferase